MKDCITFRDFYTDEQKKAFTAKDASISDGNSKVGGAASFSTLCGNEYIMLKDGRAVINERGTCGKHCAECIDFCYIQKRVKQYSNVAKAYARNTAMIRAGKFGEVRRAIVGYINKKACKLFRFHVSGELMSVGQLELYNGIAESARGTLFGIYTKAMDVLQDFRRFGHRFELNFACNISLVDRMPTPAEMELARAINAQFFIVDRGNPELRGCFHCPAQSKEGATGITCDKCLRCYKAKACRITCVDEH